MRLKEETVTAREREEAKLYLEQTRMAVTGAIKGLSDQQWRFSPEPDAWSIALILEHIIFVLDAVGVGRREALAQAPPPPPDWDYKFVDEIVMYKFPSRLRKFPTPPPACPTGCLSSAAQAVPRLEAGYRRLTDWLETTPDLRSHILEAPPLNAITNGIHVFMDGYQWILAPAAHTQRHTQQILELRAHRDFPN